MEKIKVEAVNQGNPLETIQTNINVDFKDLLKTKKSKLGLKWKDSDKNFNGTIFVNSNFGNLPIHKIVAEISNKKKVPISYSIISNNNNTWFQIDSITGDLYFNTKVSYLLF